MENSVPLVLRSKRNLEKKTPKELFSQEHYDLMKAGEKWMKENAGSCLLVAILIVTVIYPATFTAPNSDHKNSNAPCTVPSGNNTNSQWNNSHTEKAFVILATVNTIAMATSTTSIMMFFFILISRFAEEDFLISLPLKFKLGLISFFISVAAMIASFCIASVINYVREGPKWIHYFIYSSPSVPAIALVCALLYPILHNVFRS